ncbi:hypothetical protein GCM10023264_12920 [Sphingomonas daechungensis]
MSDLALEKRRVLPESLEHGLFVLAKQWLHEHRRVAEVGRHTHFRDADEVRLEHVVMHVATLEKLAQDVTHLLPDAEQADRPTFCCFLTAH